MYDPLVKLDTTYQPKYILANTIVFDAIMDGEKVIGALLATPEGIVKVTAKGSIDATGDGDLCLMAGVPMQEKPEMQPLSLCFVLEGVDVNTPLLRDSIHHDGKGGRRLVFKGQDGEIVRNPENHLEPFTAEELVRRELRQMGILDEGRQQPGSGTKPPKPQQGGASGALVDVSMARTQNEAQEIIAQSLMKQGMVNGSKEFQKAMDDAWKANNISALPMN